MADWLITPDGGRLQLDFYIEELRKAIEVQGVQHFSFIPHFHTTVQGFERQLYLDTFKRNACDERDVELIEVCDEADVINLISFVPPKETDRFVPTKRILLEHMPNNKVEIKQERERKKIIGAIKTRIHKIESARRRNPKEAGIPRQIEKLIEMADKHGVLVDGIEKYRHI